MLSRRRHLCQADFAPSFRLHSRWSALAGTVLSLVAMLAALSTSTALCAALSVLLLLLLLWCRRPLVRLLTEGRWSFEPDAAEGRPRPLAAVGPPPSGELEERLQRATAYVHDAMQVEPRSAARTPDEPTRASTCC
jgi:hypothetical protein